MSKLYKILGFIVALFILVTTITFTFGFILVGAAVLSLWGIYRYYFTKKTFAKKNFRSGKMGSRPQGYSTGEIIDMPDQEDQRTFSDRVEPKR